MADGWESLFPDSSDGELQAQLEEQLVSQLDEKLVIGDTAKPVSRFIRVRVEVTSRLVTEEEFRPTFAVHRAVDARQPWITAVIVHDQGSFELDIPMTEGDQPYDASLVIEQYVQTWNAPVEEPVRTKTLNNAGSVVLSLRDLVTQHEILNAPLIVHPMFDGKNLEAALKGMLNIKLLSAPDLRFQPMTANSWTPENYDSISQRLLAWHAKRTAVIEKLNYTFPDVAGLHAPFYMTHGVPNFPQAFAQVPSLAPTPRYWENAFDVAVMRCFPSHSFAEAMARFTAAPQEEKFSTYAMAARAIVDCSVYTPDASPVSTGSVSTPLSYKHCKTLGACHHALLDHVKRTTGSYASFAKAAAKQHVHWQSYENFSVVGHRLKHGVLSCDCEDSAALAALMTYYFQIATGLPPHVQLASDTLKSVHSLFLLMSVYGPNSTVDGKERPKGGHAAGSLMSHRSAFSERLSYINTGNVTAFNTEMLALCGSEATSAVDPVHMMEGTAPIYPNVTDMTRRSNTEAVGAFFGKHHDKLQDFTLQRATPVDAQHPDRFYSGALEFFSVNMARAGWDHHYFMVVSPQNTIGSQYEDFVCNGSSTPKSFLYAMPRLTEEDVVLQHELLKFSTPHPEFDAPDESEWTRAPAAFQPLERIQNTVRSFKRSAAQTTMIVLLLAHRVDLTYACGCLEDIVVNDTSIINMSYFNSTLTPGAELYQINLELKCPQ